MRSLDLANQGLTFALELAVYASITLWVAASAATASLPAVTRDVLVVLAVAVMATAWGLLASPKAPTPVHGGARVAFEVAWFGLGVLALWSSGARGWSAVLAALLVLNASLRAALR